MTGAFTSDLKAKPQVQNKAASSSESKVPTNGANVEKVVTDVLQIISPLFISEVSKKLNIKEDKLSPILDGFKERAALDVESLAGQLAASYFKLISILTNLMILGAY